MNPHGKFKIQDLTPHRITRRGFVKSAACIAAGLAVSPLSTAGAWAAPVGKKLKIKLRQDLIGDGIMNMMLKGFNDKNKDIKAESSYIKSNQDWGYEAANTEHAPVWYTEGEECDVLLGRGPALAQLADEGTITPLDEFLAASGELKRDDFHRSRYGGILDSATYKGSLWGIPMVGDTYALFCNNNLFAAAGVKEAPQTWEHAIESARRMTRDTNGDGKPDVFGYSQCSFQFPLQILSSGLDIVDVKNNCVHFDSDEAVEALDTYRRLIAYSPDHVDFEKGDMGMKISVTTNNYGRYARINYKTAPLPAGRRHANTYGDSDGITALAISAKSDKNRQLAAWKLIEYFMSPRMFFKISDAVRMLPLRNSIRTGERYGKFLEKNPHTRAFIDEMEYAVPKPCIPQFRFIEVVMREILYPVQEGDPMAMSNASMREHLKRQNERANARLKNKR